MVEQRLIKYGDKELPLEEGITLEQAKELMRRHFPELADPKVDTQSKGGKTVYVFSKKAGTKGADPDATAIRQRLERVKATPMDPRLVNLATTAACSISRDVEKSLKLLGLHRASTEEIERVERMRKDLADLPVAPGVQRGSIL